MRGALCLPALVAWASSVLALTIEAEQASVRTEGGATPAGWNLWSNGTVGERLRFEKAGTYEIIVRAYGTPAKGVWPRMELVLDGQAKQAVTVDKREFADYGFKLDVPAGLHTLGVAFTNDAVAGNEDRNLYLDKIEIRPLAGAPEPVRADPKELTVDAQKTEDAIVEQARKDVEVNRKGDAAVRVVDAAGKPVADAAVTIEQTRHDFLFGCNIYKFGRYNTPEKNDAYARRFADLFNYATLPFYWRGYERERGKPNYPNTDKLVAWCMEHGIRMKGHPLLWDHEAGKPTWANNQQPPPDVQKQRVTEIMQRYSGKIDFWEVVNEPAHVRGVKIDEPYRWAREADPKAYLIVNDYYVLANGYPPFFDLLQKALKDGVPFDGIGIQAHEPRPMRFPLDQVRRILDRYAALGKELHITEYSPCSGGQPITGSHVQGKWDETAQADYAVKFYTVCFAHPALRGITWWDLCDDGSWLPGGGLLRKDLSPKPAYDALKKLIHETWHTRIEGKTDAEGRLAFRGFFGRYAVSAAGAKAELHLAKGDKGELAIKLP
ncbi:MAG TPA: endo-1,4-beta-xylanase [Planctomycetota bacterium]|nr:endo-1,4-beta-xylanase [Planctomycetota bacterium]